MTRSAARKIVTGMFGDRPAKIPPENIATGFDPPGVRIVRGLDAARAAVMRSRLAIGSVGAGVQASFGGARPLGPSLCGRARGAAPAEQRRPAP